MKSNLLIIALMTMLFSGSAHALNQLNINDALDQLNKMSAPSNSTDATRLQAAKDILSRVPVCTYKKEGISLTPHQIFVNGIAVGSFASSSGAIAEYMNLVMSGKCSDGNNLLNRQ